MAVMRKIADSFMEYKTARVAVFKSRTLGWIRLVAFLFVILFITARILINNSYMATAVPLVTTQVSLKDDYFFFPNITNRFPQVDPREACGDFARSQAFALPGSTRFVRPSAAAGTRPDPAGLVLYIVRHRLSGTGLDLRCYEHLNGWHRLLVANGSKCLDEVVSGNHLSTFSSGVVTAEVVYTSDGTSLDQELRFVQVDLEKTVVALEFTVASHEVPDKSDTRYHADDDTAIVALHGPDGKVLDTCFDRLFLNEHNTSRRAQTPTKRCEFKEHEPVYLNLRSLLDAAGLAGLDLDNAVFKQRMMHIEENQVRVPAEDRVAASLAYPYRLSGLQLDMVLTVHNFETSVIWAFAPRTIRVDLSVTLSARGSNRVAEVLELSQGISTYRERYGVSVAVFQEGVLHRFNVANLFVTIASGIAVLVVVRIATDFYALTCHAQRNQMRRLKEERLDGETTNAVHLEAVLLLVLQELIGKRLVHARLGDHFDLAQLAELLYPEQDSDGEIDDDGRGKVHRATQGGTRKTRLRDFQFVATSKDGDDGRLPGAGAATAEDAKPEQPRRRPMLNQVAPMPRVPPEERVFVAAVSTRYSSTGDGAGASSSPSA